ncbi:hypothetical protein FQR65_LT20187 [Abscondita terminalis]|nr:hypothetical protein FQR65_LT20187 [Abscondita terminalis]
MTAASDATWRRAWPKYFAPRLAQENCWRALRNFRSANGYSKSKGRTLYRDCAFGLLIGEGTNEFTRILLPNSSLQESGHDAATAPQPSSDPSECKDKRSKRQARSSHPSLTPSQLLQDGGERLGIFLMCNKEKNSLLALAACIGKPEWAALLSYRTFQGSPRNRDPAQQR